MGSVLVAGEAPRVGELLRFLRGRNQIGVERLLAVCPVEPFDEGVLHRLARLDAVPASTAPVTPLDKDLGRQLRDVVDQPECLGRP